MTPVELHRSATDALLRGDRVKAVEELVLLTQSAASAGLDVYANFYEAILVGVMAQCTEEDTAWIASQMEEAYIALRVWAEASAEANMEAAEQYAASLN